MFSLWSFLRHFTARRLKSHLKLVAQLSALLVSNGLHQADALADETRPVIYFLLEHLTGSGQCGRNWSSFHLSVLHNLFSFMLGSFLNSSTEDILCVVPKFPCHSSSLLRETCIILFTKGYPIFCSSSSYTFSLVLFQLNIYCIRGIQKNPCSVKCFFTLCCQNGFNMFIPKTNVTIQPDIFLCIITSCIKLQQLAMKTCQKYILNVSNYLEQMCVNN